MLQFCQSRTLARLAVLVLMSGAITAHLDSRPLGAAEAAVLDQQILNELKSSSQVLANLTYLCDEIGPRLTGSANQKRASEWALGKMKEYGLVNVHLEAWELPEGWERGFAQARVIEPDNGRALSLASLAWAPGTQGKIEANVVALNASNAQELLPYKGKLKGAVVLMGAPRKLLPLDKLLGSEGGTASAVVPEKGFQRSGPDARAFMKERSEFLSKEGAAALFLDAGKPFGLLYSTGVIDSRDRPSAGNRLPTLYVAHNHYEMLYRLASRPEKGGRTRIELEVRNKFIAGPLAVHNTVGEIRGTEKPDEVVVVGAHLDSWDLGQGATDNGTGSMTVLETARVLAKLGIKPRRTIRFILFTGEEQGLLGSRAYVEAHRAEMPKISACLVHDTGTGKVTGVGLRHRPGLQPLLQRQLASLKDLGVTNFQAAFIGGSDHAAFDRAGVPGLMFQQDPADYRLTHHSQVDTLDRIRESDVIQGAQVMAVATLRLANLDGLLPRETPKTPARPEPKKPEGKE